MAENNQRDEVFSKSVRAGKRTYFFDVKVTRSNDYYLTITESKRRMGDDGSPIYEKHKIFLYREDFEKFLEGLNESTARISELRANAPEPEAESESRASEPESDHQPSQPPAPPKAAPPQAERKPTSFTDVNFEDLP